MANTNFVSETYFVRNYSNDHPENWVVMDSWNNPFFPIRNTTPVITDEFNLSKVKKIFHSEYDGRSDDLFLPWHYTVDIVNMTPYVIQTRPFNYKTYIPGYEKKLLIMILGDSNLDIYPESIYKMIAHGIINPFKVLRGTYFMQNTRQNFEFLTGRNFKTENLFKYFI